MNRFLAIVSLLSFVVLSKVQSKTFCEAYNETNGFFGYTLSVPTGTVHKKFIIYEDYYWELKYEDTDPTNPNGRLSLVDVNSKQSAWLKGNYVVAFATRDGNNSIPWTENTIGLVNSSAYVDWSLFPKDTNDLSQPKTKKMSFLVDFAGMNPIVAYNSYSRQEANSIIFLEQKADYTVPKWSPMFKTYKLIDGPVKLFQPMTQIQFFSDQTGRQIVPMALRNLTTQYPTQYIKGLFGVQLNRNSAPVNGTVVLFSCCVSEGSQKCNGPSLDTNCAGSFKYLYCAVEDDNPVVTHCEMSAMPELIDCLSPQPSGLNPAQNPNTGSNNSIVVEITPSTPNPTTGESGSMWWLWLLIPLILLLIIIAIILYFCCCRKKEVVEEKEVEVIEETKEKSVRSGTGEQTSSTGVPKSGTGLPKSGTGVSKSGTGESKSGTGVSKSGTGVSKSGTGLSKSGTGVSKSGTGQSGVSKASGLKSNLGSVSARSVRSKSNI